MKKIILTCICIATLLSIIGFKRFRSNQHQAAFTVGILQTASHPALEACKDGFIQELTSTLGNTVAFEIQNAQGSITQAYAIAQQLYANKKINLIYAIATPAVQAMNALEKERPIVFAAVTEPQTLGLGGNVCGVTDMIDINAEIDMLKALVPQTQTVGLLYTSGETNSLAMVQKIHDALKARGLTAIDFAVSSEIDIPSVVELACRKADVLLTPTDNTVASTITLISAIALKNKKPLLVSDNLLVKTGALAARGVDYHACGTRAAQITYELLMQGKTPHELPIEQPSCEHIYVNKATLDELRLIIPQTMPNNITYIKGLS